MKIKTTILILVFALFALTAQAQDDVFKKLETIKDVQVVHVSKSLLTAISEMNTGVANFSLLTDKLKQVDVYSSMNKSAATQMKSLADSFAKDKSYETFMSVKDEAEQVVFYGKKNAEKFKELIMVVAEGDDYKIMRLLGDFTAKDIQEVLKKN